MKIIYTLFLVCISTFGYTQKATHQFSGYFKNNSPESLYTSLYFNGKGHVLINDTYPATYVQKEDLLYIFPDKSIFIFRTDKDQLTGISTWVKDNRFKRITIPDFEEEIVFPDYVIHPELLYEYYTLNYEEGTEELRFSVMESSEEYRNRMEQLCEKGLTKGCGSLFGMLYIESSGGFQQLFEKTTVTFKENSKMTDIANRMIELGDLSGYSLLGSYYIALKQTDKGIKILEEGSEKGDNQSALMLFSIEVEKSLEDTDQ